MILLADSEGPDQTARILCCPHMPEETFSHGAAHLVDCPQYVTRETKHNLVALGTKNTQIIRKLVCGFLFDFLH